MKPVRPSRLLTWVAAAAFAAAAGGRLLSVLETRVSGPRELLVFEVPPAWSSDPFDATIGPNGRVQAMVRSALVTRARKGRILGVLAERWESSEDLRVWTFHFRRGLTFETGEEIRPSHLIGSWKWLSLRRGVFSSDGDFLEDLEGLKEGPGADAVTLVFKNPQPGLLAHLGEPEFAVTHPSCRKEKAWGCPKRAVSSGPYRILKWGEDEMKLGLRKDFPAFLRHPEAAEVITISDSDEAERRAGLRVGVSAMKPPRKDAVFSGGMKNLTGFALCASWTRPDRPCRDGVRRILRDRFFRELGKHYAELRRSFFPVTVTGIEEGRVGEHPGASLSGDLRVEALAREINPVPLYPAFAETAESLGMRLVEVPRENAVVMKEFRPGLPEYRYDVLFMAIEFDLDDPETSVRQTFLSGDDIDLPDPTGRIRKELQKKNLDLPRINDLVWEDAIVWPIGHTHFGVWTAPEVDLGIVDPRHAGSDLQWVGVGG